MSSAFILSLHSPHFSSTNALRCLIPRAPLVQFDFASRKHIVRSRDYSMSEVTEFHGRRNFFIAFVLLVGAAPSIARSENARTEIYPKLPKQEVTAATTALSEGMSGLFSGSAVSIAKQVNK